MMTTKDSPDSFTETIATHGSVAASIEIDEVTKPDFGVRLLGPDGEELPRADHYAPVRTLGVNAAGEVVPVETQPAREWYDFGKDTGPRLRVKGWADVQPEKAPLRPDDADPAEVEAVHREARRAIDEGDDAALVKLFPDVLDELHSKNPGAPSIAPYDWDALEPALHAEWREWGRSHAVKGGQLAFKAEADGGCSVMIPLSRGNYAITSDKRACVVAWRSALGEPRLAAALLVSAASKELHQSLAKETVALR
jgi:hypothetical protein